VCHAILKKVHSTQGQPDDGMAIQKLRLTSERSRKLGMKILLQGQLSVELLVSLVDHYALLSELGLVGTLAIKIRKDMAPDMKNQKLEFIIGRYDHYYDSVNNKGNVYLTVNTFILAGMISGYLALESKYHFGLCMLLLFVASILFNILSITLTLMAIKPYLNTKKDNVDGSAIFFGDVADYHINQYERMWNNMDETIWHKDLRKQATLLACGLERKFRYLSYATWFIAGQVLAVVIFGISFLNTLKTI
jgi:hypothetical protein